MTDPIPPAYMRVIERFYNDFTPNEIDALTYGFVLSWLGCMIDVCEEPLQTWLTEESEIQGEKMKEAIEKLVTNG